jgi:hypothetical protein
MKKGILLTVLLLMTAGLFAQDTTRTNVHFATSSWELTPTAKRELDSLCSTLRGQVGMQVILAGHTDSRGTQGANDTLSRRRVSAVRSHLAGCGLRGVQVRTAAEGELRPVAVNSSDRGMAQNRRVEITVISPEPEPSIDDAELNALLAPLRPKVQKFRMRCDTVQEIVGLQGTVVVVPAGTFPCSDSLTLEMIECYDKSSILAMKLTTQSGDGLLETGGMIHLKALRNGKELQPRNGFLVLMPTEQPNAEMRTYYPTTGSQHEVTWPTQGEISGTRLANSNTWVWRPRVFKKVEWKVQRHGLRKVSRTVANAFRSPGKRKEQSYWTHSARFPGRWLLETKIENDTLYQRMMASMLANPDGSYNALYVQRTNWINCDYFLRQGKNLMRNVAVKNEKGPCIAVIYFKKYDVVMMGYSVGWQNNFRNIPKNEPITIVAYRKGKFGLEVAIQETNASQVMRGLTYVPMTAEEMKERLDKMDMDPLVGE